MVPLGFWIKPTRFRIPDSLLKCSAKPKSRSISTPPKQLQNKASARVNSETTRSAVDSFR